MKAVLMSVRPKWCELIASGKKTVEVRKKTPKLETPYKVYLYASWNGCNREILLRRGKTLFVADYRNNADRASGKVIGEFVVDRIEEIGFSPYNHGEYVCNDQSFIEQSCVPFDDMFDYLGEGYGYGLHISDLVIYDEPKDLREFKPYNRTEDDCKFSHLGLAIPKCADCHECYVKTPPQSYCFVEERTER